MYAEKWKIQNRKIKKNRFVIVNLENVYYLES